MCGSFDSCSFLPVRIGPCLKNFYRFIVIMANKIVEARQWQNYWRERNAPKQVYENANNGGKASKKLEHMKIMLLEMLQEDDETGEVKQPPQQPKFPKGKGKGKAGGNY